LPKVGGSLRVLRLLPPIIRSKQTFRRRQDTRKRYKSVETENTLKIKEKRYLQTQFTNTEHRKLQHNDTNQLLAQGRWFSPGTPASSTNYPFKTNI
jgi:hypothetical protein